MNIAAKKSLLREFISKYRARIVRGLATYGEFVPATDKRVFAVEIQEELLDCGSYLEFMEQKYESLQPEIQKLRAKVILLYGEAKQLETLELSLREDR